MNEEEEIIRLSAPISGFVDYNPREQYLFHVWLKQVAASYESFGFTPLHLRPFERLKALQGEGDTQKQIFEVYRFDTGQTTKLALPFDHTVPLALWVAEHGGHLQELAFPYKRYDLGLSFRGERPKAGRFRAFVQADVDIVGKKLGLSADAECIAAMITALEKLEIGTIQVSLNHIGVVKSVLRLWEIREEDHPAVLRSIDKLDKISVAEVVAELEKIEGFSLSRERATELVSFFLTKRALSEPFWEANFGPDAAEGLKELQLLRDLFAALGLNPAMFVFAPGMVRGLAYYTGIVFETFLVGKESFGSIASGGRYSRLVGGFAKGLDDVEGFGGSIGLTRLFDVLGKSGLELPKRSTMADVLVGSRTAELMPPAYRMAHLLRKKGLRVDVYSGSPKVKHILSHANALGIPYVALVMDEKAFLMKNMGAQTQAEYASMEEAVQGT